MMRLALMGDTMLGRGVADAMGREPPISLVNPVVAELARAADITVLNLECCISERGAPVHLPGKPFFFRAPPRAVELLNHLGVDVVTLANNHALDFGSAALLDTFSHLRAAGITWVGAGWDLDRARAPAIIAAGAEHLTVLGFTDHPAEYAARADRAGVAYVDLEAGLDQWVIDAVTEATGCVLATPHWGPNMTWEPCPYIRTAAAQLVEAGVSLIAGHSAHVVHGVDGVVLYDIGDFVDDYRVDAVLRNDLGLLFLIDVDDGRPRRLEAVPLKLDFCRTELATDDDARWIANRFRAACAAFGHDVTETDGRLVLPNFGAHASS